MMEPDPDEHLHPGEEDLIWTNKYSGTTAWFIALFWKTGKYTLQSLNILLVQIFNKQKKTGQNLRLTWAISDNGCIFIKFQGAGGCVKPHGLELRYLAYGSV